MTDIRALLERAADEIGPPTTAPPLQMMRRRATLLRATVTTTTLAIAGAGVAAALVVPGSGGGRGRVNPGLVGAARPPAPGTSRAWTDPPRHASGLAVGLGSAWVGDGSQLQQRDPTSGRIERTIAQQDATVTDVKVGAGRVWVMAVIPATNGSPAAQIGAFDPRTGREQLVARLPIKPATLAGAAVAGNSLWVPSRTGHVYRFLVTRDGVRGSSIRLSGAPESVAAASDGTVWAFRAQRKGITEIWTPDPATHTPALRSTYAWGEDLLATPVNHGQWPTHLGPAPQPGSVWTTDGQRLVVVTPADLSVGSSLAQQFRYQGHGRPLQIVNSPTGVYASSTAGVDYFSLGTLRHGYRATAFLSRPTTAESPTAHRPLAADEIATDGPGVLVQDFNGGITYWVPPTPTPPR